MSEQEKSPIRKILKDEFDVLKEKRVEAQKSDENRVSAMKNEISEITKQGVEIRNMYVLLSKLKGQTIDDETLSPMKKYMEYLKGQQDSIEMVISAEEAMAAAKEASNMFEEAL